LPLIGIQQRQTLANWRLRGKGPRYINFGKKVLYPLPEIEAWEKKQMRGSQ